MKWVIISAVVAIIAIPVFHSEQAAAACNGGRGWGCRWSQIDHGWPRARRDARYSNWSWRGWRWDRR